MTWLKKIWFWLCRFWIIQARPIIEKVADSVKKNPLHREQVLWDSRFGTYRRGTPKLCVNARCLCGSNLKYKRCCKVK